MVLDESAARQVLVSHVLEVEAVTNEEFISEREKRLYKALEGCISDSAKLIAYQQFCINELMEQSNLILLDWCEAKQELHRVAGSVGGFLA
jgi:hypothetical protein